MKNKIFLFTLILMASCFGILGVGGEGEAFYYCDDQETECHSVSVGGNCSATGLDQISSNCPDKRGIGHCESGGVCYFSSVYDDKCKNCKDRSGTRHICVWKERDSSPKTCSSDYKNECTDTGYKCISTSTSPTIPPPPTVSPATPPPTTIDDNICTFTQGGKTKTGKCMTKGACDKLFCKNYNDSFCTYNEDGNKCSGSDCCCICKCSVSKSCTTECNAPGVTCRKEEEEEPPASIVPVISSPAGGEVVDDTIEAPSGGAVRFENPLSASSFEALITGVINWILTIVVSLAILFLIIGGLMYITSAGDEERIKKAKNIIMYAIVGLGVVILSWSIITELKDILGVVPQ